MLLVLVIIGGLLLSLLLSSFKEGTLIHRHPYSNPYSDATGARENIHS